MMMKFFRDRAAKDDTSSKVYTHRYDRTFKDGTRWWKTGVTNRDPVKRKQHYASKYKFSALKKAVTLWLPINSDGDLFDRARFDRRLKSNLEPYKLKTKSSAKELYRATDRQMLGTILKTLREHWRSRNRG